MLKAIICTISLFLIVGCATAPISIPEDQLPDTNRLDSSMGGIEFYTQMLIELSEAIDILSDETLSIEDRIWIYKAKLDLIDIKTKVFKLKRAKQ